MADAEPLARAICETCAQLHRPGAPLADVAARTWLIQLCEHEQAPQACLLIVRHGGQLAAQGAPIHACALAAGKVERACRERIIGGDDAFALLEQLAGDEAGDACAGAVCAAVAFWCVESGQEAAALDRCAARPVLLATAIADELARRGMMRDAAGALALPSRARRAADTKARAVRPGLGGLRRGLRGAPAAVLGALLEAAIGGDADATGALCALVEAEPPAAPVRRRGALPYPRACGRPTDAAAGRRRARAAAARS